MLSSKIGNSNQVQTKRTREPIEYLLLLISILVCVALFPLSLLLILKIVNQYQRIVVFRLGKVCGGYAKGPGIVCVMLGVDEYRIIDLRTVSFNVATQEVITRDSVSVEVDAVVFYSVYNPLKAVVEVADYSSSTRLLASTTLRKVIGTKNLHQLLSDRESISHSLQKILDDATMPWGVQVERVEMKDVRLPIQMQQAMAAEAEAVREARAKVIVAEGEIKASEALLEASQILKDNPMALQLRYLQSLNMISSERPSTVIFPFPMEYLTAFT